MNSIKNYIESYLNESLLDDEDDLAINFEKEIELFINKAFNVKGYKIRQDSNGDWFVDCKGVFGKDYEHTETLTNGLFKWGKVDQFFAKGYWNLKSLEGAPQECSYFVCDSCDSLKSLEGGPKKYSIFNHEHCRSLKDN